MAPIRFRGTPSRNRVRLGLRMRLLGAIELLMGRGGEPFPVAVSISRRGAPGPPSARIQQLLESGIANNVFSSLLISVLPRGTFTYN